VQDLQEPEDCYQVSSRDFSEFEHSVFVFLTGV
jgi:hypothetical protein